MLLDDLVLSNRPAPTPVEPGQFRTVLSHFASGVVVITGRDADGEPVGMTAQSFTALSLDPPLVLVCPARTSTTWPRISGRRFAVNVLGAGQREVSAVFARRGAEKFAAVEWHQGPNGMPLLAGAIAQLECDLESVHPGGDHHIAIGRVRTLAAVGPEADGPEAGGTGPSPLIFFRSHYWVAGPHPGDA
jgi:3-hydroxy-9,10-secoandrosta-1,3,5(10)-triene-9,17-dione monooxygenase reductase component